MADHAPAPQHVEGSRPTLPRLTSLRAWAALMVFGYHVQFHTDWLPHGELARYGFSGVGFFFVLSGFVLTWSLRPRDTARDFWVRRVARVYPSHLVMALVALALPVLAMPVTAGGVVANVLLLQAWFPQWEIAFSLNAVSWSLSVEAFFYLCAPFLIRRMQRSTTSSAVLGGGAVVVALALVAVAMGLHSNAWDVYAYTNPLVRSGEFVLGVLMAELVARGWRPRVRLPVALTLLGVALAALALRDGVLAQSVVDVLLDPFFALVILAAALADLREAPGVLQHRAMTYLGEVSFAFYLVHELAILNLAPHLADGGGLGGVARTGLLLLVAFAASVALHHAVERPAQRAVRAWWRRRRTPRGDRLVRG